MRNKTNWTQWHCPVKNCNTTIMNCDLGSTNSVNQHLMSVHGLGEEENNIEKILEIINSVYEEGILRGAGVSEGLNIFDKKSAAKAILDLI